MTVEQRIDIAVYEYQLGGSVATLARVHDLDRGRVFEALRARGIPTRKKATRTKRNP